MLKEMYDAFRELEKRNYTMFVMAVAYIFDIGYRHVAEITDEDIETLEGNGLMTEDYVKDLVRMAREMTDIAMTAVDISQYCTIREIWDTEIYE